MMYRPLQALQSLTRFQELAPGDLILTGTPVGTALSAPRRSRWQIVGTFADVAQVEAVLRGAGQEPELLAAR